MVTKSGTYQGFIYGCGDIASIAGDSYNSIFDEVYSRAAVTINCQCYGYSCAGLFGKFSMSSDEKYSVMNAYSTSYVTGDIIGGLFGIVDFVGNASSSLNVSYCFSETILQHMLVPVIDPIFTRIPIDVQAYNIAGEIIGAITNLPSNNPLFFYQVYFDNTLYPFVPFGNSSSSFSSSYYPLGLNTLDLLGSITSNFNHSIWNGEYLLIEPSLTT